MLCEQDLSETAACKEPTEAARFFARWRCWGGCDMHNNPGQVPLHQQGSLGSAIIPTSGVGADNNPVQVPLHQKGSLRSAVISTSGVGADNNPGQIPLHQQGSLWSAVIPTSGVGG